MALFDSPDDQLDEQSILANPEIRALLAQAQLPMLGIAPNSPPPQALTASPQSAPGMIPAASASPAAITTRPRTKLDSLVSFFHKISPVLNGVAAGAAAAPGPTTGLAAPGFAQQLFGGFGAARQQQYAQQQAAAKLSLATQQQQTLERLRQAQAQKANPRNLA